MKEDLFDLEHQYQLYLQRMTLTESAMHPQQKTETKRAFLGACGQMLILLRDDLSKLEENVAIEKLEQMTSQVGNFFIAETHKQN